MTSATDVLENRARWAVLVGDCRASLAALPDACVQTVVTSPPYYGLRNYQADGQIGLEPTLAEYLAQLLAVFAEVHRVLRPDGTCWVNMGDSYNAGTSAPRAPTKTVAYGKHGYWTNPNITHRVHHPALKPKDLIGVPWRLAFALQDAGWWLRSDIVWSKRNPMPESIADRPTRAHEFVFLLAKSERYFYDRLAIAEPLLHPKDSTPEDLARAFSRRRAVAPTERQPPRRPEGESAPTTRNRRDVWTIATEPYRGAHFATFPRALVEPCILAGTSARGCCPACGAPWQRTVLRTAPAPTPRGTRLAAAQSRRNLVAGGTRATTLGTTAQVRRETTGWQPGCACDAGAPVPCVVLDPFGGSGTVGAVALGRQRRALLCELNPDYAAMARARCADAEGPLFARTEAR